MTNSTPGRILFVGAGPGNPDLLTVRAREVLTSIADAWVDDGVGESICRLMGHDVPVPRESRARVCPDGGGSESKRVASAANAPSAPNGGEYTQPRRRPPGNGRRHVGSGRDGNRCYSSGSGQPPGQHFSLS